MSTRTIDVRETHGQLTDLIGLAASGTEVLFSDGGVVVARLVPMVRPDAPRQPGLHAGQGWIAEDFDEELPDDFWIGRE